MNQAPLRPTWVRVIQVLMAALILNALISFNNVYPTPYVQLDVRIGPEFVALWLVLLVLVALLGRVGRLTIMLFWSLPATSRIATPPSCLPSKRRQKPWQKPRPKRPPNSWPAGRKA